jgi:hypothetical protein
MIYAKAFYSSSILPQVMADCQFKDQITRFQTVDPNFRRNLRRAMCPGILLAVVPATDPTAARTPVIQ